MFASINKHINTLEKKIIWIIVILLVFTAGLYSFFVKSTIINIVERQKALEDIQEIHASLGTLEAEYGKIRAEITQEHAVLLGLSEPRTKTFATRSRLVQRDN